MTSVEFGKLKHTVILSSCKRRTHNATKWRWFKI